METEPTTPTQPVPQPTLTPEQLQILQTPALDRMKLPDELRGFNWGAFWLTCIWGNPHKVKNTNWIILAIAISSVPITAFMVLGLAMTCGLAIYFGVKGNEWAWKNGNYSSIESFRRTERVWSISAWVIIILLIGLSLAGIYQLGIFLKGNNIDIKQFNLQNLDQLKTQLEQSYSLPTN